MDVVEASCRFGRIMPVVHALQLCDAVPCVTTSVLADVKQVTNP